MNMLKTYAFGCLSLVILFGASCANADKSGAAAMAIKRGATHDHDPYWNPHLTIAQQNVEAQVLALVVMVLSTDKSATDFIQAAGDPDGFKSTDKLLVQLFNADPNHTVYRSVRNYLTSAGTADKYAQYAHDFRYNVFKPVALAVLAPKAGDDPPYPDNICPTAATVCDASQGLGTSCTVQ
jgi:hypothetical protein